MLKLLENIKMETSLRASVTNERSEKVPAKRKRNFGQKEIMIWRQRAMFKFNASPSRRVGFGGGIGAIYTGGGVVFVLRFIKVGCRN